MSISYRSVTRDSRFTMQYNTNPVLSSLASYPNWNLSGQIEGSYGRFPLRSRRSGQWTCRTRYCRCTPENKCCHATAWRVPIEGCPRWIIQDRCQPTGIQRCQPEMRDQFLACRIPLIRRRVPRMLASIGQLDSSWNEPATRVLTTSIEIVTVVHVVFAGLRLRGWWNGTVWLQGDAKLLDS